MDSMFAMGMVWDGMVWWVVIVCLSPLSLFLFASPSPSPSPSNSHPIIKKESKNTNYNPAFKIVLPYSTL